MTAEPPMPHLRRSVALMTWAMIVKDGRLKSWKPVSKSAGEDLNDMDAGMACYRAVETFFTGENARRWRALVLDVVLTGRGATMREMPELTAFRAKFGRYWAEHGVRECKKYEKS